MANWNRISFLTVLVLALACSASEARNVKPDEVHAVISGCDACLQFSSEAQMILSDPETRERAVELISEVACKSLPGSFKQKCVDLVNVYVPDALTALQSYLGPEICTEAGLCKPESTWLPHLTLKAPRQPVVADTRVCILCEDFVQDALTYLSSNSTRLKIMDTLHLACARLDEIQPQCDLLVDIYGPALLEQIDSYTPSQVCQLTHVCQPSSNPNPDVRDCKVAGVKRNDCAICQFVVLELKIKLKDPNVQAKLLNLLLNGCNRIQNHVDECKLIVGQYAPYILANLDTFLNADTLCTKLKVCPAQLSLADEPVLKFRSEGLQSHGRQHRHSHKHRLGGFKDRLVHTL